MVLSRVVPGGGEGMDAAIIQWLQRERRLLVGRPSAERLKIALGTASHPDPSATSVVKGRCLERGIPRSETVSAADIASALAPHVEAIAVGIRNAISEAPPELGSDVVDQGVVLTGGGSLLRDLDLGLRDLTGLPVIRAEDPEQAVAHGVGGILEDTLLQHAVALAS